MNSKLMALGGTPVPRRGGNFWFALAAGFTTFLVFCPVLKNSFVDSWDDDSEIVQNPDYNPPRVSKLVHYWVPPPHLKFYVPVEYTIWGLLSIGARSVGPGGDVIFHPAPFHAINLCAHSLSAVFAFLILAQLVSNRWAAFVGAMVFALHPIQTEAVAWASSFYSPMHGMLSLAAIWQFLHYSDDLELNHRRRAWLHYALATLFFVLAMLTKPAAAAVPLILAAIEIGWRKRYWLKLVAPLGFWLLLCIPIILASKIGNPANTVRGLEPWQKTIVGLDAMAYYLYKIVWPLHRCIDYGRSPFWVIANPIVWLTCLVPIALFVLVRLLRNRAPWLNASAAVFAAGLLPTLGLTTFNFQAFSTVADRFAYLSMFAIAMICAVALCRFAAKVLLPLAIVIVFGFGALSVLQLRHWRNEWTLFAYTIRTNPDSRIVTSNARFMLNPRIESHCTLSIPQLEQMADALLDQRHSSEAAEIYQLAQSKGRVDAHGLHNFAVALLDNEKLNRAERVCNQELQENPRDAEAHAILGDIYIRRNVAQAETEYRSALQIDPANARAVRGLRASSGPPATR